jgi:signal transduction histidine kinase/putative methionine-R-sulfoxide reductase with GAF domain
MSATVDQQLAELRRANEELLRERNALASELQARTAALARRDSEFSERIQHQSATIDVLKAMSASPGDPQPVFDLITRRAQELCTSKSAGIFAYDGELIHLRSVYGATDIAGVDDFKKAFPIRPTQGLIASRAIIDKKTVHIPDIRADHELLPVVRGLGIRSILAIPLLCDGAAVGAFALNSTEPGGFTDSQIALLQTFAEQAVIAVTSAETYRALQTRTTDLQESLEFQTATGEVLSLISRSTFDLKPVLARVAETATTLCVADQAAVFLVNGGMAHLAANIGFPPEYEDTLTERGSFPILPNSPSIGHRAVAERRVVHIHDVAVVPGYPETLVRLGRQRSTLGVPLLREGEAIGVIVLARQRVEHFTEQQIELVRTFADQAVIAIENTRLLTEQREALEQQTATAEILRVINESPGNLAPVFDAILEKAMPLCEAPFGYLRRFDGEVFRGMAARDVSGPIGALDEPIVPDPGSASERLVLGDAVIHIPDVVETDAFRSGVPSRLKLVEMFGARTALWVALRKNEVLLGDLAFYRQEVRPFSDKQIALLQSFAAQAVIAMENARLLSEIRQRQEELRITFENMGDGVAMFDERQHLVAWNGKFQEIYDLPDTLLEQHQTYEEYLRFLAERGDFGAGVDTAEQLSELVATTSQPYGYERTRPDGRVIEIRRNPVPDGGFVLIFSDITERKRSEVEIRAARDAAEAAYRDLKAAQASLIQAEKMASLGQLTAGIAHEIKNPLNFVNNFATLSVDLLDELKQTVAPGLAALDATRRAEVDELANTLASNLDKINEHGRRADGIVRGMLEHSRGSSGERREVELNVLVDEALNLAYHGARAQDQTFSVTLQRDFGEGIAPITLAPQDVTRVLLNLFSNGFYAARERQRTETVAGFEPTLKVSTHDLDGAVEIRVRDNGIGIPAEIRDRLFQPFFTTKPPGEGTGLGLSMSYDIITQQHGGSISVDSKVGEYSEFTVQLPRRS